MIRWVPIDNLPSKDMNKTVDLDAHSTYTTEEDDDNDTETISALTDPNFDLDDVDPPHPPPEEDTSSCGMAHHLRSAADLFHETLSDAASHVLARVDAPSMKHRLAHVAEAVRSSASKVGSSVKDSVEWHGRELREERARRAKEEEWRVEWRRVRYMADVREE